MEYRLKRIAAASLVFEVGDSKEIRVEYDENHKLHVDPYEVASALKSTPEKVCFLRHLDQAVREANRELKGKILCNL